MLGHPSLAQWGTPFWGNVAFEPSQFVLLESLARGEQQRTLLFDSVAQALGVELSVLFDALGFKTLDLACSFDVFQGRVPTAEFLAECTGNVLLVEMRLPAGTRRFATIPLLWGGERYEGRQVTISTIQRTQGTGTDDLQIKLDDTDEGGQDRLRDVFLADPPEGSGVTVWVVLLGDVARNRYQLFEGKVERIAGFSRAVVSVDVVRNEAVEDVELGRPVTLADFPAAPDESLSRTRPIVLGEVEAHEGVAVNANALGKLAQALFGPSSLRIQNQPVTLTIIPTPGAPSPVPTPLASVVLRNGDEFPSAGVIRIDSEEIGYTGKVGDVLTGITRGLNGTVFTEHSKGTEVQEVGDFVVLFADHVLSKLERIRILGTDDVLGEPVPAPAAVDYTNALVTWNETPKVRNPNADPDYQRIHFRDLDPQSLARGGAFAARESASYRAFGVAQLGFGDLILLTNTDGIGVPGDMLRVWIGCIFDPETLGPPASAGQGQAGASVNQPFSAAVNGIPGAASVIVAGQAFGLNPFDTVPEAIARADEKTGDRIYDVPDPVFEPVIGPGGFTIVSPDVTVDPGVWSTTFIADRIIDGDEDTEAVSFFAGFGEAALIGTADAIFRVTTPLNIGSFQIVDATLVFIAGWGPPFTPITSPMRVTLMNRLTGVVLAVIEARSAGPQPGYPTGLILNIERFEAPVPIAELGLSLEKVTDLDWIIEPVLGVSSGLWVARELFIECNTVNVPPLNKATIDPKGSVTNYFEVTHLVGLSPTRDAAADWSFFADPNRGGRVTFRSNLPQLQLDPQILETFWVVEFTPFLNASTKIPRAFADVRGLTGPGGADTPADIAEQIITRPAPLGMGLPVSRLDRSSYNPTKASLLADGVRQGFAITKPTSAVKLIEAIAEQGDCRQTWERGNHLLIRRPEPDISLPVFRTLGEDVVLLTPGVRMGRTALGEARTRITLLYRQFAPSGETSRSVEVVNAAAETAFGRKAETVTAQLLRTDQSAQLVADRRLARRSKPRWTIEVDLPLVGLELRFGDLVTVEHRDVPGGSFEVCEVVGLNYQPGGFDTIRVTMVVWKE